MRLIPYTALNILKYSIYILDLCPISQLTYTLFHERRPIILFVFFDYQAVYVYYKKYLAGLIRLSWEC